jgi:hypothetical protein
MNSFFTARLIGVPSSLRIFASEILLQLFDVAFHAQEASRYLKGKKNMSLTAQLAFNCLGSRFKRQQRDRRLLGCSLAGGSFRIETVEIEVNILDSGEGGRANVAC